MCHSTIDVQKKLDRALNSLAIAESIIRQNKFDRNQLLGTNQLLREQVADLKRDLREVSERLASKEIDEILHRNL